MRNVFASDKSGDETHLGDVMDLHLHCVTLCGSFYNSHLELKILMVTEC